MENHNSQNPTILIIGIAGGLARLSARFILEQYPQAKIIGVDNRNITHSTPGIQEEKIRYSKGQFENLFRRFHFDYVIHLARLSQGQGDLEERLNFNIINTQLILDLCLATRVRKVILLSTFHVYGALSDNPVYLKENSPLKASLKYPDLRDVVEMDQIASTWMGLHRDKMDMVILRPTNIVGPAINNAITKFLTHPLAIYPIDYNPMFQFVSDIDMANILTQCLGKVPSGIYNVAPKEFINLKSTLELIHNRAGIPFSILIAKGINSLTRIAPKYLMDYLRFSCLIDGSRLYKYIDEETLNHSIKETLQRLRIH